MGDALPFSGIFKFKVVKHWNRLPREVVDVPCLETFKVTLNRALNHLTEDAPAW